MKGVIFPSQGAAPKVVDDLKKPVPGPDQILVKSIWTAINPVDTFMSSWGILVAEWPFVLGVDAAGIVVEAGEVATSKYGFKPGDEVCGCTRLGYRDYSTVQEFFLMDARVTIPKPKNISLVEAATIGVGADTACLSLYDGLKMPMPDIKSGKPPEEKDEWLVVLGGASNVGKFAIQIAVASGYKVVASCSAKSDAMVKSLGASTFDYKRSVDEQTETVMQVTSGKFSRIYDAAASDNPEIAKALFKATQSNSEPKLFATTNDWSQIPDFEGGKTSWTQLGMIGRPNGEELNGKLEKYIPLIVSLVESEKVKPSEYELVGDGGFNDAIRAFEYQQSGAAGSRKVVVKVQDM